MSRTGEENKSAQPLRVLFVNRMAGIVRGGGETFDLEISRHLAERGCDVTLLTGRPCMSPAPLGFTEWYGDGTERYPRSMKRYVLASPYLPWFPWDKIKGGWRVRVWEFRQFEKKAEKWIRAHADDFDVIQICELPYLVSRLRATGRELSKKVVMRLTAPNAYDPEGGTQLADAVIASGMTIAEMQKGPRPDCVDIPNAVDLANFQSVETRFRQDHGIPDEALVLLYVARFQDFKNHRVLIDAFHQFSSRHPDSFLVLAGSGHLEGAMKERVANLGLNSRVLFLGEVSYNELPAIYAAADIKVISSDYESFCFAAIEAMATGLPVVTTDCGWVPNLVGADSQSEPLRDDNAAIRKVPGGLVSPVKNAEPLAVSLTWIVEHPQEAKVMGEWNRHRAVEKHGWDSSAEKLEALYRQLLEDQ